MNTRKFLLKRASSVLYNPLSQNSDAGLLLLEPASQKIVDSKIPSSGFNPGAVLANAQAKSERGFCSMKEIPLTQGYIALVDDEDYLILTAYKWCVSKSSTGKYYARAWAEGRDVRMHQFILKSDQEVDHRDGDGLNNQRGNLRKATHAQNMCNTKARINRSSSIVFKGVSYAFNGRFRARVHKNGYTYFLGHFDTAEDAARAYDKAAIEIFGEFAKTNADLGLL